MTLVEEKKSLTTTINEGFEHSLKSRPNDDDGTGDEDDEAVKNVSFKKFRIASKKNRFGRKGGHGINIKKKKFHSKNNSRKLRRKKANRTLSNFEHKFPTSLVPIFVKEDDELVTTTLKIENNQESDFIPTTLKIENNQGSDFIPTTTVITESYPESTTKKEIVQDVSTMTTSKINIVQERDGVSMIKSTIKNPSSLLKLSKDTFKIKKHIGNVSSKTLKKLLKTNWSQKRQRKNKTKLTENVHSKRNQKFGSKFKVVIVDKATSEASNHSTTTNTIENEIKRKDNALEIASKTGVGINTTPNTLLTTFLKKKIDPSINASKSTTQIKPVDQTRNVTKPIIYTTKIDENTAILNTTTPKTEVNQLTNNLETSTSPQNINQNIEILSTIKAKYISSFGKNTDEKHTNSIHSYHKKRFNRKQIKNTTLRIRNPKRHRKLGAKFTNKNVNKITSNVTEGPFKTSIHRPMGNSTPSSTVSHQEFVNSFNKSQSSDAYLPYNVVSLKKIRKILRRKRLLNRESPKRGKTMFLQDTKKSESENKVRLKNLTTTQIFNTSTITPIENATIQKYFPKKIFKIKNKIPLEKKLNSTPVKDVKTVKKIFTKDLVRTELNGKLNYGKNTKIKLYSKTTSQNKPKFWKRKIRKMTLISNNTLNTINSINDNFTSNFSNRENPFTVISATERAVYYSNHSNNLHKHEIMNKEFLINNASLKDLKSTCQKHRKEKEQNPIERTLDTYYFAHDQKDSSNHRQLNKSRSTLSPKHFYKRPLKPSHSTQNAKNYSKHQRTLNKIVKKNIQRQLKNCHFDSDKKESQDKFEKFWKNRIGFKGSMDTKRRKNGRSEVTGIKQEQLLSQNQIKKVSRILKKTRSVSPFTKLLNGSLKHSTKDLKSTKKVKKSKTLRASFSNSVLPFYANKFKTASKRKKKRKLNKTKFPNNKLITHSENFLNKNISKLRTRKKKYFRPFKFKFKENPAKGSQF